jgi:hypothetical protein
MNSLNPHRRSLLARTLLCGLLMLAVHTASGDAAGDKKRAQLANVKRVIVVAPFFGTDTLAKADAQAEGKDTRVKPSPSLPAYAEQLRKLESHERTRLFERLAARTPFQVVPEKELADALKDLKLAPARLFQNDGLIKGGRFAPPETANVRKLAERLHADAVLLGTLDEPRRSNGRYSFDLLTGVNYDSAHVRAKAGYFLLLADGAEVLHDYIEVLHPLSRIGQREYIMADWTDAEDEVIEDLMDELTRYTPPTATGKGNTKKGKEEDK